MRRKYTPSDKKCPKPQGWNGKWCTFHSSTTHNTDECRVRRRAPRNQTQQYRANAIIHTPDNTELQELSLRLATPEQSFESPHDPHGEGTSYALDSAAHPSYTTNKTKVNRRRPNPKRHTHWTDHTPNDS
eukprot:gb/GEZJ01003776.1/.p1 GENE.gb/GEZJ01003776.1/~~gb/GEZJ01003776.1/.p1  ORF type:complete len:130 (+),score=2.01 gb/GEZJ01003776.1/:939-1328(+)